FVMGLALALGACTSDPALPDDGDDLAGREGFGNIPASGGFDDGPVTTPADYVASETPADCGGSRPTWVGGEIRGSDGSARNAIIGVDHGDSGGTKIDAYGVPCAATGSHCCGGYSWCVRVNPVIDPAGSTDPSLVRTWGRCISSKVQMAYFEIYPKDA